MLSVDLYHRDHCTLASGGEELLEVWADDPETVAWANVAGTLSESHMRQLHGCFGLHPLALQDAGRDRHPPKIEVFEDHSFLILKGLSAQSETISCTTIQVAIFVGDRFLVTRHSGPSPGIARLREELETDPELLGKAPGKAALRLCRLSGERYLRILLALEPQLEALETTLGTEQDESALTELISHKSDLTRLRRTFHYHAALAGELRGGLLPGFRPEQEHLINDLYEQQERVKSLAELYYTLASDLIDGYISVASHRLNQILRILTIITAVFVPLSFLAGLYGMNFENMPELRTRFGYYTLLGIMVTITVGLLVIFRRKRWL